MAMRNEATCIGCGCTDSHACQTLQGVRTIACFWLAVDRDLRKGVCSQCSSELQRFLAGDRAPRKIVRPLLNRDQRTWRRLA